MTSEVLQAILSRRSSKKIKLSLFLLDPPCERSF